MDPGSAGGAYVRRWVGWVKAGLPRGMWRCLGVEGLGRFVTAKKAREALQGWKRGPWSAVVAHPREGAGRMAPGPGYKVAQSNDVFATPDGLYYLVDRLGGFEILEWVGA